MKISRIWGIRDIRKKQINTGYDTHGLIKRTGVCGKRIDGPAIASLNKEATQRVQRAVKILNTPARADAVELLHDAMEQFDKILTRSGKYPGNEQ